MKSSISRRDFLEKSSKGLIAAATIPYFLKSNEARALNAPAAGDMTMHDYYNHFEVNEKIIQEVMSAAMSRGGDYCDIYFQHTIVNYIGLEDKAVNRAYSNVDFGVGIRVLKGDQTGYSFTEEITPAAMKLAAKTAANIADTSKKYQPVSLKLHKHPNYYPIETPWEKVSINEKIPYLQKINDKIFSLDSRVIKSRLWFINESSYILLINSDGRVVYDYRPMGQISVTVSAEQKGKREENYFGLADRRGIEFFTKENMDRLAEEPVKRTMKLFEAVKPEAGEFVSIVDDGTNPNKRGSLNIDDEGNDTEKTFLVKNGILRSYLHDRISSQHYKVKPTGNGRRQSFRFEPVPRMRNTYMLPGPHTKEEIIRSVKKGLYTETFTNGQVFIGAGDFTFYVKSGYLIENGKLTQPVKDVNIIGNGPQVLKDIVMVADDPKLSEGGGYCGKSGQLVPVSMGLPTVKVSKITVGGVNR
jgi:TldD protein